ncbi:MAG: peroxidase family protein [Saprospiraceae bacterium]
MERIILLIIGLTFFQISIFSQENRTIDGSGNNLQNSDWGAAHSQLKRLTTIAYSDGVESLAGASRPNPRIISNTLFAQDSLLNDPSNLSDFVWSFGQFIDHDLSLTGDSNENALIPVPTGDPWFDPFGTGSSMIFMRRSKKMTGTGTDPSNPREHGNEITGWLDASSVYGSDQERADWLRSFSDGKMKISTYNLLPWNTFTGNFATPVDWDAPLMDDGVQLSNYHFVAGDPRANENPLLVAFHTLFVREHNRLCDTLKIDNPSWTDEELYQHARKIVGGLIQNVVYSEWLPAMGVNLDPYIGYDETIDARIVNVFSGAAFRLGHTLLNSTILRLDNDGNEIAGGNLQLQEAFFNPQSILFLGGGIDPLFKGMGEQVAQDLDCKVINDVRNFLFGPPGAGGLDLVSININRGRERGLPDFNTVRADFGLTTYTSFLELNSDTLVANAMEQLYGDINNIDAWVGMLAENKMPDALFGETIMEIMKVQFSGLRDGDRFYFENDSGLSAAEILEIKSTTLHDIIMRNTNITLMQPNVFEAMPHNDICDPNGESGIAGVVINQFGENVQYVDILLENDSMTSTSSLGMYELDVSNCQEHTATLSRTDNPANGVTTFDMVLIRKHILHLEFLDSPWKLIAADVNRSKEITTFDLVHIQQVILGLVPDFPNSPSWLFLEEDFTFDDPSNPFTTVLPNNVYTFSNDSDTLEMNYMALKIGDVNDNANPNFNTPVDTRNEYARTLLFNVKDRELKVGEEVEVYLETKDEEALEGYQLTFNYDSAILEFLDLTSEVTEDFSLNNYALFEDRGAVTVSYAGDFLLEKNKALLHFTFRAKRSGKLSDLLFVNSKITKVEAYSAEDELLNIDLSFEGEDALAQMSTEQFKLYQNQPNPFNNSTEINFYLPAASDVDLKIFDLSGKILASVQRDFAEGLQTLTIDKKDFDATGVFYYQLQTAFGTLTKKMVRVQ